LFLVVLDKDDVSLHVQQCRQPSFMENVECLEEEH